MAITCTVQGGAQAWSGTLCKRMVSSPSASREEMIESGGFT